MSMEGSSLYDLVKRLDSACPSYTSMMSPKSTEEFIESFYTYIGNALNHLEKNAKHFSNQSEEALSATLAAFMSIPGVRVLQETYSGGHVDLTFEIGFGESCKTILGEAKIYAGPEYHKKGLSQLMDRYLTGRETQGAVIEYVKKRDIKGIMGKVRDDFDDSLPAKQQGPTEDHSLQWAFKSKHLHESGEGIIISHLGCNLYVKTVEN
ncbi:MAG: hypothetical protein KME41_08455 [Candidatus Thiodiazotropha sp. (ex Lucina pensylvanica)]|nr:hypothetical protein [Candidatus Thiodiazotropha sp. (ex Lucina pensylvanica)]